MNEKHVIGVDLGGTKILSAVVSADGSILSRAKLPTGAAQGVSHVLEQLRLSVQGALEQAQLSPGNIVAMTVGSPGPLDAERGVVLEAPNLGWHNVPLAEELEERTGVRTFVENDVDMGTLGEHVYGAARGCKNVVGVFVGTGIGGGVIIRGKLVRGSSGVSGEIGHIIVRRNGVQCNCGAKGCMEAYAGRWAIEKRIHREIKKGRHSVIEDLLKKGQMNITSGTLKKAWKSGDEVVRETLIRACKYLGAGIASVVNLLSPEVIVLGGGLFEALGKDLLPITMKHVEPAALEACLQDVKIVLAALGDDASVLGASVAARERGAGATET